MTAKSTKNTKKFEPIQLFSDFELDFIPTVTFPVKFAEISVKKRTVHERKFNWYTQNIKKVHEVGKNLSFNRRLWTVENGCSLEDSVVTAKECDKFFEKDNEIRLLKYRNAVELFKPDMTLYGTTRAVRKNDTSATRRKKFIDEIKEAPGMDVSNVRDTVHIDPRFKGKRKHVSYAPIPDIPSTRTNKGAEDYITRENLRADSGFVCSLLDRVIGENETYVQNVQQVIGYSSSMSLNYRKCLEVCALLIAMNAMLDTPTDKRDTPLHELLKDEKFADKVRKDFSTLTLRAYKHTEELVEFIARRSQKPTFPLYVRLSQYLDVRDSLSRLSAHNIEELCNAKRYHMGKFYSDYTPYEREKNFARSLAPSVRHYYDNILTHFSTSGSKGRNDVSGWVDWVVNGEESDRVEPPIQEVTEVTGANVANILAYAETRARKDLWDAMFNQQSSTPLDKQLSGEQWHNLTLSNTLSVFDLNRDKHSTAMGELIESVGVQYVLHHIPLSHLYILVRLGNKASGMVTDVLNRPVKWYKAVAEVISQANGERTVESSYNASHAIMHMATEYESVGVTLSTIKKNESFAQYNHTIPMSMFLGLFSDDNYLGRKGRQDQQSNANRWEAFYATKALEESFVVGKLTR